MGAVHQHERDKQATHIKYHWSTILGVGLTFK
jgi:hypothetical protein